MQTKHLLEGWGGIYQLNNSIMVISRTIGYILETGCYAPCMKWAQIKLKQCQVEVDSLS